MTDAASSGPDELAAWLGGLGLEKYDEAFRAQDIDLRSLPYLTESDLQELGVSLGHRKIMLAAIATLSRPRLPMAEAAPATAPGQVQSEADRAERRLVSVLFCDMVGSTELARRLDPEDLRQLLRSYQDCVAAAVTRYGGHLAQYLGDGVMAYFGWPSAHEDDAERCVRAALEIVEAARAVSADPPLRVRIGVATGMVIVGDASHAGNREPALALGETPNLASRLQDVAGPNEVVIASTTRRLIGERFEVTELRNCSLKGIAEPVTAWRVHALRRTEDRFETSRELLILTPLVGREDEIGLLLRACALRLAAACHLLTLVLLAALPLVCPQVPLGWIYWSGVGVVAALLIYEHLLVRPDDLTRVNIAFFNINAIISIGLFVVGAVDLLT